MLQAFGQVKTVGGAVTVSDDQGRTVVGFGVEEGPQRVGVLRAVGHGGDVDVAIGHRDLREVLLAAGLPAAANFAMAPRGVALDICPPVLE